MKGERTRPEKISSYAGEVGTVSYDGSHKTVGFRSE
jgi:hypothetical protein